MPSAVSVQPVERRTVAFGPFTFDRTSKLLWKDGVEVPVPPRVLGVLGLLLERQGELVTKQELISAVWRDAFVTETSLAEAISVLRQTLGDDPQRPTYIQTLHRRGYRFVAGAAALPVEREPRLSQLIPWIVALFALLTAASAIWRYLSIPVVTPREPVRFSIALPAGLTVATTGAPIAVSNDGSLIALAACRAFDCGIYLRPLSQNDLTLVAGSTGGASPFFSPDGRSIGYAANGRLYVVALSGGSPIPIADAPEPLGAVWLRSDQVVFARSASEGLFVVGARGGRVETLTRTRNDGHRWPSANPDESTVLFTVDADRDYAAAVSMRTRSWARLLDDVTAARVPFPEYLLAQRGGNLIATAVDRRAMSTSGLPVPVAALDPHGAAPQFAMSAGGVLVIAPPAATTMQVALDWASELRRLVPLPQPALPR